MIMVNNLAFQGLGALSFEMGLLLPHGAIVEFKKEMHVKRLPRAQGPSSQCPTSAYALGSSFNSTLIYNYHHICI